ncbi:MAG TPA: putative porin [Blastocatellia bacterium]|nr:putative porin [Blastocatellia bacterium]
MFNKTANKVRLALMIAFFFSYAMTAASAAQQAVNNSGSNSGNNPAPADSRAAGDKRDAAPTPVAVEERLKALEQVIERQQREIQTLRELVEKRGAAQPSSSVAEAAMAAHAPAQTHAAGKNEATPADPTQKRVDELYKKFGAIRFSGDIRFRGETFSNQGFDALVDAPARNRLRVRARVALDGSLGNNFDWGFRIATGIFTDPISTNQTLTDFFERKPFALERAFVRYDSKTDDVGVQLVAGKFEPTFRKTQMVWDDDVNVEGASEALYFKTSSSLRQIKLVAFQLPFDEQSGLKDGVLFGGQAQTDWQFSKTVSANVNVAYYDWNRADRVLLALGAATTQVNGGIANSAGLSGGQNGALGTTNRIIRNAAGNPIGFLANFHLLDILGNLTWQAGSRVPVSFVFDYVRNMSGRIDNEQDGYWAGVQVGQNREPGDWLLGYTFTRIEQDAVLVPFNFSDILASNSRVHMPTFGYQVANGVTLQWTGLFSQRANRAVPLSPFNRWLNRMQFDVIYKF